VNVAVHMVTTPLGLIGALALLRGFTKGSGASLVLCFLYLLTLLPLVPIGVFAGTALLCGLVAILARYVRSTTLALTLILLGYLLQDLSHLATNETTFQSTYSAGGQVRTPTPHFRFRY
jgi:ABC-type Fe3+-siderophore transport system permease subunit